MGKLGKTLTYKLLRFNASNISLYFKRTDFRGQKLSRILVKSAKNSGILDPRNI